MINRKLNTSFATLKQSFFKLKFRLFVLEHKIMCHPVLRNFLPHKKLFRKILAVLLCFAVLAPILLVTLKPANVRADWYGSGWQYRKQITIDHTKVPSTQT